MEYEAAHSTQTYTPNIRQVKALHYTIYFLNQIKSLSHLTLNCFKLNHS